jgi:hypothetical protein
MDSIKCVIGRKQVALMKESKGEYVSASNYYKIWSMNGFIGQQKLRIFMNYENHWSFDQRFIYRYSQEYVEGVIGKINHLTKIFGGEGRFVTIFML